MTLTSGDHYAGFKIAEFLGSGPTGSRYRAVDLASGDTVHLKIISAVTPPDQARRQEFRNTSEILMRAGIPGVVRILDVGEAEGRQWISTELITGVSTDELLHQRFPAGIPHQSVCVLTDRVARALDAAARHGVVHGNISPADILLSEPFSKNYRIAVTGFGHRHAAHAPADKSYAAPEVLAGAPADNRSDQFMLAASVFHLLTGRPPFGSTVRAVTTGGSLDFAAGALERPSIGVDGLEQVFARAFAFDPEERFGSCGEFVDALISPVRLQAKQVKRATSPTPLVDKSKQFTRRRVLVPAAVALVATAAVTIAAFSGGPSSRDAVRSPSSTPVPAPAVAPGPACQKLDEVLAGLDLRRKLAQTLMVGVTDIDDASAVVNDQHVGGIFIASWTDLSMLTSGALRALQSATRPIPLAVSVDEEGGRVQRLKTLIGSQDSPRQLVAEGMSAEQVHAIAFERGRKMRDYGITIDFAPVVDVTGAAADSVIGDRAFGPDPETVTEFAGAYAQGLRDAGLLPVLKHFPGHGHASGDSHHSGVTTPPLDVLLQKDTVPYRTLTTIHPVAVMLGHMQVPGLTDTDPASLSEAAYALLREGRYGGPPFDGPTFTDDLSSMGAITQLYTVPEAVLKALQAGADTALWVSTDHVPAVLDRLESAVNSGELATSRVDDAVRTMAVTKNPELACSR